MLFWNEQILVDFISVLKILLNNFFNIDLLGERAYKYVLDVDESQCTCAIPTPANHTHTPVPHLIHKFSY